MIEANLDDHTLFRYCGWHEDSERIHVAMIDFTGHQRGIIARSYRPDATPKALTHKDEDYHGMSYFTRSAGVRLPSVLVVEDCMSGLVVYDDGYNAVSLNGTTLNDWRISELARAASEIVLCLDADATQLAARYVRRYRGVAPITMRRLHTDIKDKTAPVRQEWYKEIGYVSD
jgi:DNA primase